MSLNPRPAQSFVTKTSGHRTNLGKCIERQKRYRALINYRFPPPSGFTAGSTSSRLNIGQNVHVALEDNKGDITVELDNVVRLVFTPSPEAPEWTELGIALDNPKWLECRRVHLKYSAASRHPARVHAALRLVGDIGFQDVFAPNHHYLSAMPIYFAAELSFSPRLLERVHSCALQLFFDNQNNSIDIHNLVLSGFR